MKKTIHSILDRLVATLFPSHKTVRRLRRVALGATVLAALCFGGDATRAAEIPITDDYSTAISLTAEQVKLIANDTANDWIVSSVISGNAFPLIKAGPGTLWFTGNNSHTNTALEGGTFGVAHNNALGTDSGSGLGFLTVTGSGALKNDTNRSVTLQTIVNTGQTLTLDVTANSIFTFLGSFSMTPFEGGVFKVQNGATLQNAAGAQGTLHLNGFFGMNAADKGGVLYNAGMVNLSDVRFNEGMLMSGIGGGVYNTGSLTLTDAVFSNNSAANGGGIYTDGGSITLNDASFYGNIASAASGYGGAVFVAGTTTLDLNVSDGRTSVYSGNLNDATPNSIHFATGSSVNTTVDTARYGVLDMADSMTANSVTSLTISKDGVGTWKMGGTTNLTGSVEVTLENGTLHLYGDGEAGASVAVGQITSDGDLVVKGNAMLSVGGAGSGADVNLVSFDSITLHAGARLGFDLAGHDATNLNALLDLSAANSLTVLGGSGTLAEIVPNLTSLGKTNGNYVLLSSTNNIASGLGALTLNGEALAGTRVDGVFGVSALTNKITLSQGAFNHAVVTWTGGSGDWNLLDSSWTGTDTASNPVTQFLDGDYVIFSDIDGGEVTVAGNGADGNRVVAGMEVTGDGDWTFTGIVTGDLAKSKLSDPQANTRGGMLTKDGEGDLTLQGRYRFATGIALDGGTTYLEEGNSLETGGNLKVGDIRNETNLTLGGETTVGGKVTVAETTGTGAVLRLSGTTLRTGGDLVIGGSDGSTPGGNGVLVGNGKIDTDGNVVYVMANDASNRGTIRVEGEEPGSVGLLNIYGNLTFQDGSLLQVNTDHRGEIKAGMIAASDITFGTGNVNVDLVSPISQLSNSLILAGTVNSYGGTPTVTVNGHALGTRSGSNIVVLRDNSGVWLKIDIQNKILERTDASGNWDYDTTDCWSENLTPNQTFISGDYVIFGGNPTGSGEIQGDETVIVAGMEVNGTRDWIIHGRIIGDAAASTLTTLNNDESGTLNKYGTGTLTLLGGGSFARFVNLDGGTTIVETGATLETATNMTIGASAAATLRLNGGRIDATTQITVGHAGMDYGVAAITGNGTLSIGNGTAALSVYAVDASNYGLLSPGTTGFPIGTLAVEGDLTMSDGSRYAVDIDPLITSGQTSDLITVTGTAALGSGGGIIVTLDDWAAGTYVIMTAGSFTGVEDITVDYSGGPLSGRQQASFEVAGDQLQMTLGASGNLELVWNGAYEDDWNTDTTNKNWYQSGTTTPEAFYTGDLVVFTNKSAEIKVDLAGVTVGGMKIDRGILSFSGGAITGNTSNTTDITPTGKLEISVDGTTAIFDNAVSFSDGIVISDAAKGVFNGTVGVGTGGLTIGENATAALGGASRTGNFAVKGDGVLSVTLAAATNTFQVGTGFGTEFAGTVSVDRGIFTFNDAAQTVQNNLNLRLGTDGTADITKNETLKSLEMNGGALRFAATNMMPDAMLSVDTLTVAGGGTISTVGLDVKKTITSTQNFFNYATDASALQYKLIAADTVTGSTGNLTWTDNAGNALGSSVTNNIEQGGNIVGTATFGYTPTLADDGLYVGYTLTEISVNGTRTLELDVDGATGAKLTAKLTGAGNYLFENSGSTSKTVEVGNSTSDYTGTTAVSDNVTVKLLDGNAFGNSSSVNVTGSGTVDLNNRDVQFNALNGNGTVLMGTSNLTVASGTFAGTLDGSGLFIKTGTGTLTLSGDNDRLSNTIKIEGGTLSIGDEDQLGSANLMFDTDGTNTGKLAVSGATDLTGRSVIMNANGTIENADDLEIASFTGSGRLTKAGTGSMTVYTSAPDFTGGITIAQGTLIAAVDSSLGTGDVLVDAKLVLNDFVSISNAVRSTNTGVIEVGTGHTGTLSDNVTGYLEKGGAGTLVLANGASLDKLTLSDGTLKLDVEKTIDVTGDAYVASGKKLLVGVGGTVSADTIELANGANLEIDATGADSDSPMLTLDGPLTIGSAAGDTFNLNLINTSNLSGTYTVIDTGTGFDFTDTFVGTINGVIGGFMGPNARYGGADFNTGEAGKIVLTSTAEDGARTATWDSQSANGLWNETSNNWSLGGDNPNNWKVFKNGDTVVFGNTGAGTVTVDAGMQVAVMTVDSSSDYTFTGGSITSTGTLTKTGTGSATFQQANTFGAVNLQGGTLTADATDALGTATVTISGNATLGIGNSLVLGNDIVLSGNGRLGVDGPGVGTASGVISGNGKLTKTGTGFLYLNGPNTYTGGTQVDAGVLSGDTDSIRGPVSNNAELNFEQNTDGIFSNAITGTGALRKTGTGKLTLGDGVTQGFVYLDQGELLVASGKTVAVTGGVTVGNNTTLGVDIGSTPAVETGGLSIGSGATLNITGYTETYPQDVHTLVTTTSGITGRFDTVTVAGVGQMPAAPDIDVFLEVQVDQAANDGKDITIVNDLVWKKANQAHGTFNIIANETFTLDADLADNTQTGAGTYFSWDGKTLSKTGEGTLILAGSNWYTGGTKIDEGTVRAEDESALGTGTAIIGEDGTLELAFDGTLENGLVGGGTLNSEGDVTINRANGGFFGQANIVDGTLTMAHSGALGTAKIANGSDLVLDFDGEFVNDLNGNGNLVSKGNVVIDRANAGFSGSTTIVAAGLTLRNEAALGTSATTIAGGAALALEFDGTFGNSIAGLGTLTTDGEIVLAGENVGFGGSTINRSGTLTLADRQAVGSSTVTNNAALVFDFDGVYTGSLKGNGALTTRGNVVIDKMNADFGGATTVESDTLTLKAEGALGTSVIANDSTIVLDYIGELGNTVIGGGDFNVVNDMTMTGDQSMYSGTIGVNSGTTTLGKEGGLPFQSSAAYEIGNGATLAGVGRIGSLHAFTGGTVSPGYSPGTLETWGSVTFDAGSTYHVEVEADSDVSDKLEVGTTASVANDTTLNVDVLGTMPFNTTREYTIIETRNGIDNEFSRIVDRVGFSFDQWIAGNNLYLSVTSTTPEFAKLIGDIATRNALSAADGMDRIILEGQQDRIADLYSALANLAADPAIVAEAFIQLHGEMYATNMEGAARMQRLFDQRLVRIGRERPAARSRSFLSCGDVNRYQKRTLWGTFTGDSQDRSGIGSFSGYDLSSYGVAVGLEQPLNRRTFLGVAFGYEDATMKYDSLRSRDESDIFRVSLYGGFKGRRDYSVGYLGYGKNWHDARRSLEIGNYSASLKSKYDDNMISTGFEWGRAYKMARGRLIPSIGFDYVHVSSPGIVEQGGIGALSVASDNYDSLRLPIGARWTRNIPGSYVLWTPEMRVYYVPELLDGSASVRTSYLGTDPQFEADSGKWGHHSALFGVGIKGSLSSRLSFRFDYDYEVWRHTDSHRFGGSASYRW